MLRIEHILTCFLGCILLIPSGNGCLVERPQNVVFASSGFEVTGFIYRLNLCSYLFDFTLTLTPWAH